MSIDSDFPEFDDVLKAESPLVRKRREVAFPSTESNCAPATDGLPDDLVGLALSGGGLRSAAYNLGFLQALSHFGIFRYVDYMCSVSGGGYIAGHVTSVASKTPNFHDPQVAEQALGVDRHEELLPANYRFRHLGEYLLSYASFLWRYVASTMATLLLFTSLLGFFACLTALVWRSHDSTAIRYYRELTGINAMASQFHIGGEALAAFMPAVALFGVFLLLAIVRYWITNQELIPPAWLSTGGRDPTLVAQPIGFICKHSMLLIIGLLVGSGLLPDLSLVAMRLISENRQLLFITIPLLLMVGYGIGIAWMYLLRLFDGSAVHGALWVWLGSLAISCAVFMGNGNSRLFDSDSDYLVQSRWSYLFGISAMLSFIPVLAAGQLARSGQTNAPLWKRRLFLALIGAATLGCPIAFIHLAARENISGFATHRAPDLLPEDIRDWNAFITLLGGPEESKAEPTEHARHNAPAKVTEMPPASADHPLAGLLAHDVHASGGLRGGELADQRDRIKGQDSWEQYRNAPLVYPLRGAKHFMAAHLGEQNVFTYCRESDALQAKRQKFLDTEFNPCFFPRTAVKQSDTDEVTQRLMKLVVLAAIAKLPDEKAGAPPATKPSFLVNWFWSLFKKPTIEPHEPPLVARMTYKVEDRRAVEAFLDKRTKTMAEGNGATGQSLRELWNKATLHGSDGSIVVGAAATEFNLTHIEQARFNRLLLECLYPDIIRERQMVSTSYLPPYDQEYRAWWMLTWLLLLVLAICIDYNRWSPFYSYYRDRLMHYFVAATGATHAHDSLDKYKPWENGAPIPLLLGSHFLFARVRPLASARRASAATIEVSAMQAAWQQVPTLAADASKVHPFVFSPLYCGGPAAGYCKTENYCGNQLTLSDAMAISGSALTPFLVDNVFFSALMAAFNLRIGQWLPHPKLARQRSHLTARGFEIARELWQGCFNPSQYPDEWKLTLVADGGFHDFFGLEQLLLRRCQLIIISDAGCNNGHFEFSALADVIRMVRERHGIAIVDLDNECPANVAALRREKNTQAMHHICFRVLYPAREGQPAVIGLLVYAQMSLTGREPLDLQQFRNLHPSFPDEPITNQFFDARQVESYRQLGYHVGRIVCSQTKCLEGAKRDTAELMRAMVRGYLADHAAHVKIKDAAALRGFAGIDLFENRSSWCPRRPSNSIEIFVSEKISRYLTEGETVVEGLSQLMPRFAGSRQEASWARRIAIEAIALVQLHRSLAGDPTANIFCPGGHRVMIRALATIVSFRRVLDSTLMARHREGPCEAVTAAWCVIGNCVFQQSGAATTAEYLFRWRKHKESRLSSPGDLLVANLREWLEKAKVGELYQFIWAADVSPVPPPAEIRASKRK